MREEYDEFRNSIYYLFTPPIVMRLFSLFTLTFALLIANQSQAQWKENVSIHGYTDMVFMAANVPNYGFFSFVDVHRVNIQPRFEITEDLSLTMLLEGMDLFTLDESDTEEEPGIVEWAFSDYLINEDFSIRIGRFPLPFGVYNERFYATSTQLTSFLPSSLYGKHDFGTGEGQYSDFAFARNPTGIQFRGQPWHTSKHLFKYAAYFANEPVGSSSTSLNKYFGGRLSLEPKDIEGITLGASFCGYLENGSITKYTPGADLQAFYGNFQVVTELILTSMPGRDSLGTVNADRYQGVGTYIQTGYTIKDLVTPYFRFDLFDYNRSTDQDQEMAIVAGINLAFNAQFIWKVEYYLIQNLGSIELPIYLSTLAVAF